MAKQVVKKSKKKRIIIPGFFLRLANIIVVAGLLTAYASPWINPNDYWLPAFFGLSYPLWLAANLFFIVFWAVTRRKFFLVSLITVAIGFTFITSHFQIRFSEKAKGGNDQINLVTYNVKHLNESNRTLKDPEAVNNIFKLVIDQKPDIACFQEFFWPYKEYEKFINTFKNASGLPYYAYRNYQSYMDGKRIDCIITFSRYPILKQESIDYGNRHFVLIADILFNEDTIRVVNTHLQSIYFGFDDYRFVNDVTENGGKKEELTEGSKRIFWKLRKAFFRRAIQAERVEEAILKSPYPVILCGDFNDTPASYAYHKASAGLTDAFKAAGKGYGNTFAGKLPGIRIDHIFYSDEFEGIAHQISHRKLSDHYMVSATLEYSRK